MIRRYEINARIGGEFQINDRRISEAGEIYFTRTVQDQQKWLLKTRSADQTLFQEQITYWLQVPLHAHLLAVGLQVERHEGLLFMLQPIIQDEEARHDLGEWLQDGVLPLATALKITLQIASGLNALHEAGMVHGNIKPGHVLLRHEGNIMLTDFCPPDQVTVDASNAPYLAPETSRDIRSDIYALGSLLYQMLTGKSAFVGSTLSEIRAAHETSTHESLSDDVPAALVSLIERCLQHDPMQRYQTPAELLDDLALIYTVSVGEIPSEVAPPQIPPLQIHWSRGQAYMALQQTEKAIENFNAALEIKPDYVPALVMRGSAQYRLGNYDAALADLNAAASIDDNDPLLHSRRGMTHLSLHNYENALADFDTALQRNPQNAEALYYRADTYQAMGESDKALIDLERLREFMPTDIKGLLATGNVLHDLRRHEDALLMYQQAHEQMPEDATILTARGSAYAMLGLMQKALQDFEQALALNPLAVTYARRGDAYVNLGQPEKALEDYTQALELDSYEISAVVNRGATLQQMGRYEEALPDLTRAIELFPDSAVAYTNRSQAYRALNRLEEALADAEKSVELDPDKAATYVTRGILYRMLERDEEALADYQKALEINPGLAQIHHNIAVLHIQRDRKEAALPHLEQAARLGSAQSGMLASQIRDELSLTQPDSIRRGVEENNPLAAMFMPESVSESTAAEAPSTQSASQEMRTESANASRTLLGRSVQFKPGDHINDIYEVHQALVGGMGEVYLCLNRQTNLPVALKSFQRRFMNSAQIRSLFEQEVATWISLGKHPNIVHCMHTVHVGDRPFAVLEWVVGEQDGIASLRDRLERGSLPVGDALRIALHICRGLIHAAEKQPGIVHRDLKPDNVLLASGGIAKITDFGLAKVVADDASEGALNPTDFSKSNQGGTPLYMAPEQWAGGAIDARTDAYAVGAILYEMLTGNKLFNADSRDELRHLHEQGAVPSLSIVQEFTAEIDTVLQTCLAKDKSERYETIQALYEALHDIYRQVNGAPLEDISDEEEMTVYDYISRGYTYSGLQLHEAALADLNKAVELAPHWPHAYIKRAAALNNTGRYKEALDDLNQAIRLDPTNDEAYFRRSYSYQGQAQHKQALADMQRAAELVPRKPEYVLGVHRLSTLESMNPDQLRPVVQSMTPQSAIEYGLRANLYSQLGDIDAAIADYERALQLDPLSSVNLLQYGMMLLVQEQPHRALEALEKAAEVGHPRARLMLPDLRYRMGLTEQAPTPEDEASLCAAWAQDVKMLALHSWRYPFMNGENFRKHFAEAMTEDADPRHRYLMEKRLEWLHELQQYLLDHPQKPDAQVYHMAGLASINVGLHSIAILHLNEAIDMQPENAEVFANRGKV